MGPFVSAVVVAGPLQKRRAFSPDSYSAGAVRHVRPFDRKTVRFRAVCPKRWSDCLTALRSLGIPGTVVIVLGYALSVVYVNGNMGGRGFSRADDEFRTQVMLNVSTYCAAVPPSVGGEKLDISKRFASAADLSF